MSETESFFSKPAYKTRNIPKFKPVGDQVVRILTPIMGQGWSLGLAVSLFLIGGCTIDFSEKPPSTDVQDNSVSQDDEQESENVSEKDEDKKKDKCPGDPNKTKPGICGCGVPEETCITDPYIEMSKDNYEVNETVVVHFFNLAGRKKDWVGIFVADTDHDEFLDSIRTQGKKSGTMSFEGFVRGEYDARLFFNDSDKLLYEVSFTVGRPQDDACPSDPTKTEPGVCGCGIPDLDSDGDLVADCEDACPKDASKTEPGVCGCGIPDLDPDGGPVTVCVDQCPEDPSKTEPGVCGCGVPEDCV